MTCRRRGGMSDWTESRTTQVAVSGGNESSPGDILPDPTWAGDSKTPRNSPMTLFARGRLRLSLGHL